MLDYLFCNSLCILKLEPGDRILAVNGEDVKDAPRDHVIQLVRSCDTQVSLLVCQPAMAHCAGRKSTLLSAGKRAKLRSRPSRVRFAESVCVNGAPLFPVSIYYKRNQPNSCSFICAAHRLLFIENKKYTYILAAGMKHRNEMAYLVSNQPNFFSPQF